MPWFLKNNLHTSDYYPSQKNSWMRFTSWLPGVLGLTIIFFTACRPKGHSIETVEQAMKKYDRYILHMDVDSISLLYAPDGELGKMAKGRDSIRRFLENFKKYRVLSQVSKTNLINVNRDTALQSGLYTQKVIIPVNDTVTVKGLFS